MREWAWDEVSSKDRRSAGVVVVIDNKVYDVSRFLDVHPGGANLLLDWAGRDASEAFSSVHNAKVLQDYQHLIVGQVKKPSASSNVQDSKPGASMQEHLAAAAQSGQSSFQELILSVENVHEQAIKNMPSAVQDYVDLGAEDEESLRNNRAAWSSFALRPRVLRNVSQCSIAMSINERYIHVNASTPIAIAPFAGAAIVNPEHAECAVSEGATMHNALYVIPHYASIPVEQLARNSPRFLQLYAPVHSSEDPSVNHGYLNQIISHIAENVKAIQAIVLTVDSATYGNREKTYRNPQWVAQLHAERGGMPKLRALEAITGLGPHPGHSAALDWDDVAQLIKTCHAHKLGLVLKGILALGDAMHAAKLGIDGLVLSNHGGRQLDAALATATAAYEILPTLRAQYPSLPVWVDGGIRRGKDVFRALAMGCSGVFVGRPALWGLAYNGSKGVDKVLDVLNQELVTVMKLTGCATLADIRIDHIAKL